MTNADKLLATARANVGKKLVDDAHMDKGCVIAVNVNFKQTFGHVICDSEYTPDLLATLISLPTFTEVNKPSPGDIGVAATGTGNGTVEGHTCIADKDVYMSNDSATGVWKRNHSPQYWESWFGKAGGIKTRWFHKLG